jgi:type IV secretion system protein VirB10
MVSGINSQLPGQCTGQVKQDVYDSATGQHLLIPAGAQLVCTYDSAINGGQERVFVAWTRINFPDGSSIILDSMPGADQSGLAGFKDQVNNHYVRTFGQAFLLSLFSAGIQLSQPRGAVQGTYNAQQIGAAAIGQQLGMLGMQIARRNLNMQPTLEIRPGFEFTIAVNKDMVLPPWQGHPMAQKIASREVE